MVVATAPIYRAYAPIYDAIGQGRFGERQATWALRWLAERGARAERVLDLACGTGVAALTFAAAGCRVVGVDLSPAMLAIAAGRARDAGYDIAFVEGDIRNLPTTDDRRLTTDDDELGRWSMIGGQWSFDLVTCFADSLNYLTDDGDLDRVFAAAALALRPGGVLVFDINTAAEYTTWDERDVVTYDGHGCLVYNRLSYDPAARLATGQIVWFVREAELWWRGEETHTQRAWSDAEVRDDLTGAGLVLVECLSVEGEVIAAEAEDVRRMVYIARK